MAEWSKAHDWKSCRVNSPRGFESLLFRRFLSRLLLAAASLLVLAFAPAQYLGRQQDDLLYVIAAHALPTGRYELMTAVGHPPLTSTAPGWPLLMAPLALVSAPSGAFQAFAALLLAACPWLLWWWLRRRTGEREAVLAALVFAASPVVLSQAGTTMPEAAYLLVFLGALLAAESGRSATAGGLGAWLVLIRPAGLSALPALAARPALAGKWKDAAKALGLPLLAAAAWSAWSMRRSGGVQEASELAMAYGHTRLSPLTAAARNLGYFATELGGCFLPPRLADGALAALLGAALLGFALRGLKSALKKEPGSPAGLALLGALFMHAVWTWHYERYLIPLLPLLLWALILGLGKAAPRVLAALLAAQLGFQTLPRLGRPAPWGEPELARTYAWLRADGTPGALASALPVRDGWHAGLPCLPLPDDATASAFAATLASRRARFVLRQDGLDFGLTAGADAPLSRMLDRAYSFLDDASLFRVVHEEPAERARVYELRGKR